jgi:hypothetical protein
VKEKADQVGIAKGMVFCAILGNASVARNYRPLPLPAQPANPFHIRGIAREFFGEGRKVMTVLEQFT